MLPKQKRLSTALFSQVFKSGRMYHSDHFWIKAVSLPVAPTVHDTGRFAVAVTKKVGSTAVARNRIKRAVYNAVKEITPQNFSGLRAIIGAKTDIVAIAKPEIQKELSILLKKLPK